MTEAFAPPGWSGDFTRAFASALGPTHVLCEAAADRHGSWEWAARSDDDREQLVFASVTEIGEGRVGTDDPQTYELVVWLAAPHSDVIDATKTARIVTDTMESMASLLREELAELRGPMSRRALTDPLLDLLGERGEERRKA